MQNNNIISREKTLLKCLMFFGEQKGRDGGLARREGRDWGLARRDRRQLCPGPDDTAAPPCVPRSKNPTPDPHSGTSWRSSRRESVEWQSRGRRRSATRTLALRTHPGKPACPAGLAWAWLHLAAVLPATDDSTAPGPMTLPLRHAYQGAKKATPHLVSISARTSQSNLFD